MAMVDVGHIVVEADSTPKSVGSVGGSATYIRQPTFVRWTRWTLAVAIGHDDSTINIVLALLLLLLLYSANKQSLTSLFVINNSHCIQHCLFDQLLDIFRLSDLVSGVTDHFGEVNGQNIGLTIKKSHTRLPAIPPTFM